VAAPDDEQQCRADDGERAACLGDRLPGFFARGALAQHEGDAGAVRRGEMEPDDEDDAADDEQHDAGVELPLLHEEGAAGHPVEFAHVLAEFGVAGLAFELLGQGLQHRRLERVGRSEQVAVGRHQNADGEEEHAGDGGEAAASGAATCRTRQVTGRGGGRRGRAVHGILSGVAERIAPPPAARGGTLDGEGRRPTGQEAKQRPQLTQVARSGS